MLDKELQTTESLTAWAKANSDNSYPEDFKHDLLELETSNVVRLLEALPPVPRTEVWELISPEQQTTSLPNLRGEACHALLDGMETSVVIDLASHLDAPDLVKIIDELPAELSESIIQSLASKDLKEFESVMAYEEGTAGRLLTHDVVCIKPKAKLGTILRWLSRQGDLPRNTTSLMVVDTDNHILGSISVSSVISGNADASVESVMQPSVETVLATATEHEIITLFEQRELTSVVVVDEESKLLGRITADEIIKILRKETDDSLMKRAGLDSETDLFAAIVPSAKQRGIWLGLNLLTVLGASWVIGQFQPALDKIVALAVLLPVVSSMGGIAGSQTLTLTIRGLALDQIAPSNIRWLALKEISVGALNGIVWSTAVAVVVYFWFDNLGLSIIIAASLILNLVIAAFSGIVIPLVLKRLGTDPALSGAVILTTVTDIIGFFSFLGLASVFLL